MQNFIKYLYYDSLSTLSSLNDCLSLLSLGDFYCLRNASPHFKASLESNLSLTFDRSNALGILEDADRLGANRLKQVILRYICQHFAAIFAESDEI